MKNGSKLFATTKDTAVRALVLLGFLALALGALLLVSAARPEDDGAAKEEVGDGR